MTLILEMLHHRGHEGREDSFDTDLHELTRFSHGELSNLGPLIRSRSTEVNSNYLNGLNMVRSRHQFACPYLNQANDLLE